MLYFPSLHTLYLVLENINFLCNFRKKIMFHICCSIQYFVLLKAVRNHEPVKVKKVHVCVEGLIRASNVVFHHKTDGQLACLGTGGQMDEADIVCQ